MKLTFCVVFCSNVHDGRVAGGAAPGAGVGTLPARAAPLLRSRTLPSIVVPGLSILHAQIESTWAARNKTSKSRCTKKKTTRTPRITLLFNRRRAAREGSRGIAPPVPLAGYKSAS